jgi:hypothetical protein
VTIVAGFKFSGGVLLCADTEMTDQVQKFQSTKMMLYAIGGSPTVHADRLMFGIAGNVEYARRAVALCESAVAAMNAAERTNERIQLCIEDALTSFHEKFIYSHPLYRELAAPIVSLMVGVFSHVTGHTSLLSTNECVVNEVLAGFDFVGQGASFARYIAQLFWREKLTQHEAHLLAAHVLQQTKQNAPNCGKKSDFVFLKDFTGEMMPVWGLQTPHMEIYSDQYVRLFGKLFYDLADTSKSFEEAMEDFYPIAHGTSHNYKLERTTFEAIARQMEETQKKKAAESRPPSASQSPQPEQ